MSKILIVIPSRYQSTRLPGKPLIKISGTEMVKRVADIAGYICKKNESCSYVVATDDSRIIDFCRNNSIPSIITSDACKSGTERCWDAVKKQVDKPELIINLQGDNPLCPPYILQDMIDSWKKYKADVFTPCIHLSWTEYDRLKKSKETTPYSGTTVLVDKNDNALAFSKTIIPTIRKIDKAKEMLIKSPVRQHIGLYAYAYSALEQYFSLPQSDYEKDFIEGLEQMRFLENGLKIKMVEVNLKGREFSGGVDSSEDITRVEEIIKKYGEFDLTS